jgi:CYTH domain-containing protein
LVEPLAGDPLATMLQVRSVVQHDLSQGFMHPMFVVRRFLVSPAFARLVARESTGSTRIVEGYFTPSSDNTHFVRVERDRSVLVLASRNDDIADEFEVPLHHAEALMDVAAGRVAFDRISLPLGGEHPAILDRFLLPAGISVISLLTGAQSEGELAWFGPEVTNRPEFTPESFALRGAPVLEPVEASNAGLAALLDLFEGQLPFRSATVDPGLAPTNLEPEQGRAAGSVVALRRAR